MLSKWFAHNQDAYPAPRYQIEPAHYETTQGKREAILAAWLEEQENINPGFDRWHIPQKQSDVWHELGKRSKLFSPASTRTIVGFFSAQSLCSFKTGRK